MNIAGMNRGGGSEGALIMPKLPKVPQKVTDVTNNPNANNYYLSSDGHSVDPATGKPSGGGRPSWKQMPDPTPPTDLTEIISKLNELESKLSAIETTVNSFDSRLTAIEARLNAASINAQCQNGTVTVTLNL